MERQETILGIIIFVAAGIVIFIYLKIKEKIDLNKAESGEDMAYLKKLVAKALPGEMDYQVAYAHWEKEEYKGRRTITTYYSYALAFDESRLFVIPVTFDKDDDMVAHEPLLLTKDMLGIADVFVATDSVDEKVKRIGVTLFDKEGRELVNFLVDAANTREDRFHRVNIVQYEECRRFSRFMANMASQVSRENAGLEDRLIDEELQKSGRTAIVLGIIGIVTSIIMPIISIILGVIGLIKAPKPGEIGRFSAGLVLSMLAFILGVGATVLIMMVI